MASTDNILQRHLTEEDFKKWDSGSMPPEEMEFFLSHTASCDTCCEYWMAFMEQSDPETLLEPPAYLSEEILSRSKQPDLLIAREISRTSKKLQLLTYSLKVCTAVACSIIMLFSINLTKLQIESASNPPAISRIQAEIQAQTEAQMEAASAARKEQWDITGYLQSGAQTVNESLQNFAKFIFDFNFDTKDTKRR